MSQENRGNNSSTPVSIVPAKRRRGRPRKDENRNYVVKAPAPSTPVSDLPRRNQHQSTESTAHTDNALVGQIVSGVLDGSFDAGYLLTVKVGNTNTVLRGVVFGPGLSVPISADNDVAPHAKMFKRSELPLPVIIPLNQVPLSTPFQEVKNEQPTIPISKTVTVVPVEGPLGDTKCLPKQPLDDSNHVSQVVPQDNRSSIETESTTILSKGRVDGVHQTPIASQAFPSNNEEKSTSLLSNKTSLAPNEAVNSNQSEPKTENPVVVLQESETCLQPRLSNGATATNDLKQEPLGKQSVEISLGESGKERKITVDQFSRVQTNTSESALNLDSAFDVSKGAPAEISDLPLATPSGVSQENRTSQFGGSAYADTQARLVAPQGTFSNVSNEILKRDETTCLIEGSVTDTFGTKNDLQTRPMTDALFDMQSGYAANQPTLGQYSMEPQSFDLAGSTHEEYRVPKDAVSMQASVELVTSSGLKEPTDATDDVQVS